MGLWVALLYSVTLTPDRRVTSTDLVGLSRALGFHSARSVLSTGNLILEADGGEDDLALMIESELFRTWGRSIPVLLRQAQAWRDLLAANPFPEQSTADPAKVAVRVMRHAPDPADIARLMSRCGPGEAFAATERALWLASEHQLSVSPLQRAMAAPKTGIGTFRNISAVRKIAAALD